MPADRLPRDGSPPHPEPHTDEAGFSVELHKLRRWSGLTLDGVADKHETLTRSTTSDYLRGKRLPKDWAWVDAFVTACLRNRKLQDRDINRELIHWQAVWNQLQRDQILNPAGHESDGADLPGALPGFTLSSMNRVFGTGRVIPGQLPHDIEHFTGRTRELAALDEQATARKPAPVVVKIIGLPGVGKTGLAVHWSHQQRHIYRDGVLYADLNSSSEDGPLDPGSVLGDFLHALGVPDGRIPKGMQGRAAVFRSLTKSKRLLIVLDDAASYKQVRPLLPAGPSCCVLVTTRTNIPELLVNDDAFPLALPPLDTDTAIDLLTSFTGHQQAWSQANNEHLRKLAEKAAGSPQALRIIAAVILHNPDVSLGTIWFYLNVERGYLPYPETSMLEIELPVNPTPGDTHQEPGGKIYREKDREQDWLVLDAELLQKCADSDDAWYRLIAAVWIYKLYASHPEQFDTMLPKLLQDSDIDVRAAALETVETMADEGAISAEEAARFTQFHAKTRDDNDNGGQALTG